MEPKWPAVKCSKRDVPLCTHSAPISITHWPRPIPRWAFWASRCGYATVKYMANVIFPQMWEPQLQLQEPEKCRVKAVREGVEGIAVEEIAVKEEAETAGMVEEGIVHPAAKQPKRQNQALRSRRAFLLFILEIYYFCNV